MWWDCGSLYLAKDRVTSGGVLNGRQYLVLQLIGDRNQMRPFPGVEDPFHPLEDPIREKSPPDPRGFQSNGVCHPVAIGATSKRREAV